MAVRSALVSVLCACSGYGPAQTEGSASRSEDPAAQAPGTSNPTGEPAASPGPARCLPALRCEVWSGCVEIAPQRSGELRVIRAERATLVGGIATVSANPCNLSPSACEACNRSPRTCEAAIVTPTDEPCPPTSIPTLVPPADFICDPSCRTAFLPALQVLAHHEGALQACFNPRRQASLPLFGELEISFAVDASGRAIDLRVDTTRLRGRVGGGGAQNEGERRLFEPIGRCAASVIEQLRFAGGDRVTRISHTVSAARPR